MSDIVPFVSKPGACIPAGAWDCHAHIFGPYDRFPLAADRDYTPPECDGPAYLRLLETLGFAYGVLVQGASHGQDNRAMLAALTAASGRLRGVGVTDSSISDESLASWRQQGVVGLRFTHIPRVDGALRFKNTVGLEHLEALAPRMRALDLHAELWIHASLWHEAEQVIARAGVPVMLDHMGRFDPAQGLDGQAFRGICRALGEGRVWLKMVAYRNVALQADLPELRAFHRTLVGANADQLVWGSDWPHVNLRGGTADAGALASLFVEWTGDAALAERMLVQNPARLYGRT